MEERDICFLQWFSNFTRHQDALDSWFKPTLLGPTLKGGEFAFLTSIQGLLLLLVRGPHLQNHGLLASLIEYILHLLGTKDKKRP